MLAEAKTIGNSNYAYINRWKIIYKEVFLERL
jgi:hypothetical protein